MKNVSRVLRKAVVADREPSPASYLRFGRLTLVFEAVASSVIAVWTASVAVLWSCFIVHGHVTIPAFMKAWIFSIGPLLFALSWMLAMVTTRTLNLSEPADEEC